MNYGVVHHKSLNSKLAAKWELLLLELGARGQVTSEKEEGRSRYGNSIYLIESEAKKIAAKILIEEQTLNRNSYTKDLVPRDACWGSVVSLNFDTSWFSTKPPRVMRSPQIGYDSIRTPELRRMYGFHLARFLERSPIRVWHPNGCVSHPKSLRLGIREFGLQIDSINEAFQRVKAYERRLKLTTNFDNIFKTGQSSLDGDAIQFSQTNKSKFPLSWVAEMLYRPVVFAGVGMSSDEIGLWWLMVQRARNWARIPESERPQAGILIGPDTDNRIVDRDFWKTNPFGIIPIFCNDWEEGWQMVLKWGQHCGRVHN